MNKDEIIAKEDLYSVGGFKKRQVAIVKGKDALLWDSEGNEYIDCVGGQGVANIGHCNENVISAVTEQIKKLIICPNLFYNDSRAMLLEKLVKISGLKRAFLCNSGTEAVEAAIKFARISTGKKEIIAAMKSFHGRTFGALSATWKKEYREPFEPLVPGFNHVPFNNMEELEKTVTDNTAAILLEVVQGEGGVNIGSREYFSQVRELCDEKNILLIIDEVQTGFGRTGKMFAHEHYGIKPDILCLAKSIAAGIPMGAVVCNEKINVPPGAHATTFGGYPFSCAAALASIEFIEKQELCNRSKELGEYFINELKRIESNKIREIRGIGLMIGVELKEKPVPYLHALMDKGVLALPAGLTVLRYLPPLVITKEQIDIVVEKTREVLQ
ncbi:aspartate aminotransferase family protein [Candidatus Woesearchaeota archaeon]|nr:aspartate aminotransferase family protein [Candidatus Woesearchaeota archaeon]